MRMKPNFSLDRLLGAVYRKGNLIFSTDGNSVVSPVGNRVSVFDLKNSKTKTLKVESRTNFTCLALSPDGVLLIAVNEENDALLISVAAQVVVGVHRFHRRVNGVAFSPDGSKFAVLQQNLVFIFKAPGRRREFNPFELERTFHAGVDDLLCVDWSLDSSLVVVGSCDAQSRVLPAATPILRLGVSSLGAHSDAIVGAFFAKDSYDVYTVSANRQLRAWTTEVAAGGIQKAKEAKEEEEGEEEEEEESSSEEEREEEDDSPDKKRMKKSAPKKKTVNLASILKFALDAKHKLTVEGVGDSAVTCVDFHKATSILVAGFENGAFLLFELPDCDLIHKLQISTNEIAAVTFNSTGDWIAFGCGGVGQLLVWEWQSETYVIKQQGHFDDMTCLAYSRDGLHLATGGADGRVKLWRAATGFSHVTFSEHSAGVVDVVFVPNGKAVLSASLDGTVRAFDLKRYRNFKTLTSPKPVQFSCLAIDPSGDVVAAGGLDAFDVFVWSLQTGRLLEILTGHQAPLSGLGFSPVAAVLASTSWDKSLRTWDVFESKGSKEIFNLVADGTALAWRMDGAQIAVATLDAQILLWTLDSASQIGSIEGRHDLGYGRRDSDKISGKTVAKSKSFKSLCFSADGDCLLAAGDSPFVCLYSCAEGLLLRRFQVTRNESMDAVSQFLDRRQMTEFGSLSLVDSSPSHASLPGVRSGDASERRFKPEARVAGVAFSPTGREFAACATDGLVIFSLDATSAFDPFELDLDSTPAAAARCLRFDPEPDFPKALVIALKLNDEALVCRVLEATPPGDVAFVVASLPLTRIRPLLDHLARLAESSPHLGFYLRWISETLMGRGPELKAAASTAPTLKAALTSLQKTLTTKWKELERICNGNQYSMEYLLALADGKKKREEGKEEEDEEMTNSESMMTEEIFF